MSYVIVDHYGASRGHFDSRSDLLEVIDEIHSDDPHLVDEFFVVEYDDNREQTGDPVPASRFLPERAAELAYESSAAGSVTKDGFDARVLVSAF